MRTKRERERERERERAGLAERRKVRPIVLLVQLVARGRAGRVRLTASCLLCLRRHAGEEERNLDRVDFAKTKIVLYSVLILSRGLRLQPGQLVRFGSTYVGGMYRYVKYSGMRRFWNVPNSCLF